MTHNRYMYRGVPKLRRPPPYFGRPKVPGLSLDPPVPKSRPPTKLTVLCHLSPNRFNLHLCSLVLRNRPLETSQMESATICHTFPRSACCVLTAHRRVARRCRGLSIDRSGQSDIKIGVRLPPVVGTRMPLQDCWRHRQSSELL